MPQRRQPRQFMFWLHASSADAVLLWLDRYCGTCAWVCRAGGMVCVPCPPPVRAWGLVFYQFMQRPCRPCCALHDSERQRVYLWRCIVAKAYAHLRTHVAHVAALALGGSAMYHVQSGALPMLVHVLSATLALAVRTVARASKCQSSNSSSNSIMPASQGRFAGKKRMPVKGARTSTGVCRLDWGHPQYHAQCRGARGSALNLEVLHAWRLRAPLSTDVVRMQACPAAVACGTIVGGPGRATAGEWDTEKWTLGHSVVLLSTELELHPCTIS